MPNPSGRSDMTRRRALALFLASVGAPRVAAPEFKVIEVAKLWLPACDKGDPLSMPILAAKWRLEGGRGTWFGNYAVCTADLPETEKDYAIRRMIEAHLLRDLTGDEWHQIQTATYSV